MNKKQVFYFIKATISAIGISSLLNLPVVSIYPLLLWGICLALYRQETTDKRKKQFTTFGALLFSGMLSLGIVQERMQCGWKVALIQLIFIFTGSTIFLQWLLVEGFTFFDNALEKQKRSFGKDFSVKKIFGVSIVVMILFWIPVWLAHAPALMNSDTIDQIQQALGIRAVSNHHPAIHTLLIRGLYQLISLCGVHDIKISFGIIGLLQLFLMAAVCAGAVTYVYCQKRNKCIWILMIAFYGLVAYNAYYSISLWKDTLHAGITVLFLMTLHAWFSMWDEKKSRKLSVEICALGLLFCLFRSNAMYALLLWSGLLLFLSLNKRLQGSSKGLLLIVAGVFVVSLVIKGPVYSSMGITGPVFTEKLSVPLQQVACVVANDRELSEQEAEMINKIARIDDIRETYTDYISDPIKSLIAMCGQRDYMEEHKGEYFQLWMSIGIKYPKDYLFAWINQTKGYWYPNTSYWVYFGTIMANDLGLETTPIISWNYTRLLDRWVEQYKEIPLYGSLWNLGVYSWLMIFLELYTLYRKRWTDALLVALPTCLWVTLLISTPVYAEFRYLYAVILSMPLLTGLIYGEDSRTPDREK